MNEAVIKPFSILLLLFSAAIASAQRPADDSVSVTPTTVDQKTLTFAVGQAAKFATVINGRSHQQTPVTTHRGYQYAVWYDSRRRVCIGRRKLETTKWKVIRFTDHKIKSNDAHNTVVIGICHADGTIHIAFDHHATQLNYRISKRGVANDPDNVKWKSKLFSPIQHSLGAITPKTRVTYPRFFNAANGNLMLYYRGGTSGNGDGCIEEYDGTRHRWTDGLGAFIARDQGSYEANGKVSQFRCPYMNDLSYAGNRLHASWVWRDRFEKTKASNQHDLCYAYSDDNGRTWRNSAGTVIGKTGSKQSRLIDLNSPGLIVAPIPIGNGLTNQNTQFAYPDGSIHVVVRQQLKGQQLKGKRQQVYQHYWRNAAGKWSTESLPFKGRRPKIVGAKDRRLYLVFNDDDSHLRISKGTPNADRTSWNWTTVGLPNEMLVSGEPLVDVARWKLEKVLSIYCQQEPRKIIETKRTKPVNGFPTPLHVIDVRFENGD